MQDLLGRAPARRYAQRHADPARLWVQAFSHGCEPPSLERARVLELGCGDGAHLLGVAARHPNMRVVGVDPRADALAEGKALAERAGVSNLRLQPAELGQLDRLGEPFDYVICEGAYSRAAPAERQLLLSTVARLLAPGGLACIEYDVRPAFRMHELAADIVRRSLAHRALPPTAEAARAELLLLLETSAGGRGIELVRSELEAWRRQDDAWLAAELAWPRQGLMFSELASELARHGLSYLCEASYQAGSVARLPEQARALVERETEPLRREQYVDFFSGRRQRRSLLVGSGGEVSTVAPVERVSALWCVSWLQAVEAGFLVPGGAKLHIADALEAAVVRAVCTAWPAALSQAQVTARVRAEFSSVSDAGLAQAVLSAHEQDFLELRASRPGCALAAGTRPRVSLLNRVEAQAGRPLTNALHAPIQLGGGMPAALAACLDGEHDREALRRELRQRGFSAAESTPAAVERVLDALARRGLLEPQEPP